MEGGEEEAAERRNDQDQQGDRDDARNIRGLAKTTIAVSTRPVAPSAAWSNDRAHGDKLPPQDPGRHDQAAEGADREN